MSQGLSYTLVGYTLKLSMPKRDLSFDLLCHLLHCTTFGRKYAGFILVRKIFLHFIQLVAEVLPKRK